MTLRTIVFIYIVCFYVLCHLYYRVYVDNNSAQIETFKNEFENISYNVVYPVYKDSAYKGIIKASKVIVKKETTVFIDFDANLITSDGKTIIKCAKVLRDNKTDMFYFQDEFTYNTPKQRVRGKKGVFDLKNS